MKWQRERIGGEQPHARLATPRELAARLAQHGLGKIGAHHGRGRARGPHGERQVAGAGGEVENGARRRGDDGVRSQTPPRVVAPAGHQRVHDVVAPRDPREHLADGARGLAFYHQSPPTTDASTMTAM